MKRFLRDEQGATAIEYGLIAALVILAMLAGLTVLGGSSSKSLGSTANKVSDVM